MDRMYSGDKHEIVVSDNLTIYYPIDMVSVRLDNGCLVVYQDSKMIAAFCEWKRYQLKLDMLQRMVEQDRNNESLKRFVKGE